MKKYWREITIAILAVIFIIFGSIAISKISNMSDKMDNYENTIAALNDTIKVSVKNGITTYSQKTPEIDIADLTNSEYFKTLSGDQQKYYKELKSVKGLISSTKAELELHKQLLDSVLAVNNGATLTNDSIAFKRGTELKFAEEDTSKKLQWTAKVDLDSNIKFNMDYTYNATIQTSFVRQKDESIVVNYAINDPDLKVTKMQNFIIPTKQRTKVGAFFYKHRKVFRTVGGVLIFAGGAIGGGAAGYYLAK